VKRHWSVLDGDNPWLSAWRAISPLLESPRGWQPHPRHVVFGYAVGIALLLLAIIGAAKSRLNHRFAITVTCAMGGVALGYIAFYTYDSAAVQAWYFAITLSRTLFYMLSNSLKNYLAERHIYRVVDDAIMWESGITRAHGGYAGDVMTRCIDSKLTLWQTPIPLLVGDHVMLSTLDPQCLSGVDHH
jgi:hypothetical protein